MVFVSLIVCSLVGAGLGTAVLDGWSGPDEPLVADSGPSDVERRLREAVLEDPTDVASLAALANLLANSGQLAEAIQWYERALTVDPDDWETRLNFALDLADGGNGRDAELQLQRVLAAQPASDVAHFALAELYRDWQPARADEAAREYRSVIEISPDTYLAEQARAAMVGLGRPIGTPAATPTAAPGRLSSGPGTSGVRDQRAAANGDARYLGQSTGTSLQ